MRLTPMPDPTDADRVKAKSALGELGGVTTAVEAVARALAKERAAAYKRGHRRGHNAGFDEGICK